MKTAQYFLFIALLYGSLFSSGQTQSVEFSNKIKLKDGVYLSNFEILNNQPTYPDLRIESKINPWTGGGVIFYSDEKSAKSKFTEDFFGYVQDGILYINYNSQLHKLILTGSISTFFIEKIGSYDNGYPISISELYFVDMKTWHIDFLTPLSIEEVIKRDSTLYSEFSKLSYRKKNKILYTFVLKYNSNNPIYINDN